MPARAYRGTSRFGSPVLTVEIKGPVCEDTPASGAPIMAIDAENFSRRNMLWGEPIAALTGHERKVAAL